MQLEFFCPDSLKAWWILFWFCSVLECCWEVCGRRTFICCVPCICIGLGLFLVSGVLELCSSVFASTVFFILQFTVLESIDLGSSVISLIFRSVSLLLQASFPLSLFLLPELRCWWFSFHSLYYVSRNHWLFIFSEPADCSYSCSAVSQYLTGAREGVLIWAHNFGGLIDPVHLSRTS